MNGLSRRGKVYWIDYRVNGKRYRESTGTILRREAEYIYACRKKEAKEGKIPEIKKIKAYMPSSTTSSTLVSGTSCVTTSSTMLWNLAVTC